MIMPENYHYFYDQYYNDVETLKERYDKIPDPHIVAIYRGGFPLGVHLSNILKCPLSLVKYQSRDGEDHKAEWLLNLTDDKKLHSKFFPELIVVDDIYDTGKTMKKVMQFLSYWRADKIQGFCLYGKKNNLNVSYANEHKGHWIVFPWEEMGDARESF